MKLVFFSSVFQLFIFPIVVVPQLFHCRLEEVAYSENVQICGTDSCYKATYGQTVQVQNNIVENMQR